MTNPYTVGCPDAERARALQILHALKRDQGEELGILEIGIFGSFARGTFNATSDVDVCVRTRTPNPYLLVSIRDKLEKELNRRVDVVRVRDKMNPYLKSRIDKEVIYV